MKSSAVPSTGRAMEISIAYALHAADARGGPGTRPRTTLIHSLALDRSIWNGVVPLLTRHAGIVTYDCCLLA